MATMQSQMISSANPDVYSHKTKEPTYQIGFRKLFNEMKDKQFDTIRFSAYRTASKIRFIQQRLLIGFVDLSRIVEVFKDGSDELIDYLTVERIISRLLYQLPGLVEYLRNNEDKIEQFTNAQTFLAVMSQISPDIMNQSIQMIIGWIVFMFDDQNMGSISVFSLKILLSLLSSSRPMDKFKYHFSLLSDNAGNLKYDLFEEYMKTMLKLVVGVFEGSNFAYTSEFNKFMFQNEFLDKMMSEPGSQALVWLTIFHRLIQVENVIHHVRCEACRRESIIGLRYKCTKCPNYNLCRDCFWRGIVTGSHSNSHDVKEYTAVSKSHSRQFGHTLRKSFQFVRQNSLNSHDSTPSTSGSSAINSGLINQNSANGKMNFSSLTKGSNSLMNRFNYQSLNSSFEFNGFSSLSSNQMKNNISMPNPSNPMNEAYKNGFQGNSLKHHGFGNYRMPMQNQSYGQNQNSYYNMASPQYDFQMKMGQNNSVHQYPNQTQQQVHKNQFQSPSQTTANLYASNQPVNQQLRTNTIQPQQMLMSPQRRIPFNPNQQYQTLNEQQMHGVYAQNNMGKSSMEPQRFQNQGMTIHNQHQGLSQNSRANLFSPPPNACTGNGFSQPQGLPDDKNKSPEAVVKFPANRDPHGNFSKQVSSTSDQQLLNFCAQNDGRFDEDSDSNKIEHLLIASYASKLGDFMKYGCMMNSNNNTLELSEEMKQANSDQIIAQLEAKNLEIMEEIHKLRKEQQLHQQSSSHSNSFGHSTSNLTTFSNENDGSKGAGYLQLPNSSGNGLLDGRMTSMSQYRWNHQSLTNNLSPTQNSLTMDGPSSGGGGPPPAKDLSVELRALKLKKEELNNRMFSLQENRRELLGQLQSLMRISKKNTSSHMPNGQNLGISMRFRGKESESSKTGSLSRHSTGCIEEDSILGDKAPFVDTNFGHKRSNSLSRDQISPYNRGIIDDYGEATTSHISPSGNIASAMTQSSSDIKLSHVINKNTGQTTGNMIDGSDENISHLMMMSPSSSIGPQHVNNSHGMIVNGSQSSTIERNLFSPNTTSQNSNRLNSLKRRTNQHPFSQASDSDTYLYSDPEFGSYNPRMKNNYGNNNGTRQITKNGLNHGDMSRSSYDSRKYDTSPQEALLMRGHTSSQNIYEKQLQQSDQQAVIPKPSLIVSSNSMSNHQIYYNKCLEESSSTQI